MGLGGITRDSILDLQALVHDDNTNNNNEQQLSGSFNSGKKNDFSSLLNEPPPDLLDNNNSSCNEGSSTLKRVESFKEPLNDTPLTSPAVAGMTNSIDGLLINGNHGIPTSPSAGLSSLPTAAATSNTSFNKSNNNQQQKKNNQQKKKKNVSSTNSRSLDSYSKNNYSNFQYEGYTDYYDEAEYGSGGYGYGYDDYKNSLRDNSKKVAGGGSPGSNLLSCLFPWIGTPKQDGQRKILDTQPSNSSSSISLSSSLKEAELDKEEARQHAVNEEAAAQSAAAAAAKLSTLPATTATTSPSSPKIPLKQSTPTPSNKPPTPSSREVTFAKSMSPPKATIPHMMSVDSTSTAHSTSTSSAEDLTAAGVLVGESIVEDEKKQEEVDNTTPPALPTNFPKVPDLDKDTTTSTTTTAEQLAKEAEKQFKSILKVRRCSISLLNANSNKPKTTTTKKEVSSDGKRHFLPTYEPKKSPVHSMTGDPLSNNTSSPKSINFNPMARVLTIPSRKDIPLHQKAQVWWQRSDYDEFKKTGRIISKAMECGGSEIWLASSNAWGKAGAKRGNGNSGSGSPRKVQGTPGTPESETKLERSNSDSSKSSQSELEKSEIEYNKTLSRYVKEDTDSDGEGGDNPNKWWCKFGHSRRGLEHIASSTEGRARQQSVLLAIRMVMEEQKRQRASRTKDPNKLRNVSMQYTSWARDLSLAAGAADHEAVESGFDPQASNRARHFAKRISIVGTSNQDDGSGMLTHSHKVAVAVTSQILDANTHATPRTTARKKAQTKSLGDIAAADSDTTSLSKRAKGFMPGGNGSSAAEMMAGMGNVPQPRRSVKV